MENFDISKYINMVLKRKWWIIISFLISILCGLAYLLETPKIYKAETLILVQEQKVPQEFVRSIVSTDAADRLQTISQQVQSRTNLEKIIENNKLYTDKIQMLLEDKVALLRKNINIHVASSGGRGGSAFSISFEGMEPRKVMQVTNDLASNFISENIKYRETQAIGTEMFLADELEERRQQLVEKEEELKNYRERYRGGLPEQLQTNLSILQRLQGQLEQLNSNLRAAENRKVILQQSIASGQSGESMSSDILLRSPQNPITELESLKHQLEILLSKYTDKHPDVMSIKKRIADLEASETVPAGEDAMDETRLEPENSNVKRALKQQLKDIQVEISKSKEEIEKVNDKIKLYEARVEDTPKRELELISLNRDYDNIKSLYHSMLDRKLTAEVSVSLERKQKGEQFKILDPAKLPVKPIKPDAKKILIMAIALGLGLGFGIAYLLEFMDTSYRTPDEAGNDLKIPILASIPLLVTENELKSKKRKEIFIGISLALGFFMAAFGIVIAAKGFDKMLEYVKGAFGI